MVELRVVVVSNPSPRELRRLLRRHRVLDVALVIEVESGRQVSAIARHYHASPLRLPADILLANRGEG